MFELLFKYLIINKKATFPGIGIFTLKRQPASHDFTNKIFVSPAFRIDFSAASTVDNSRFYIFVAAQQKIREVDAIENVNEFASAIKGSLAINNTVQLPGLGIISYNAEGVLQFTPSQQVQNYFPHVSAERAISPASENTVMVVNNTLAKIEKSVQATEKEEVPGNDVSYWWVYAIILALISIAAIVYYYTLNGTLR